MRLFISYARVDQPTVKRIDRLLRAAYYETWYDNALKPGQKWEEQIQDAVLSCEVFLYMLTPESVASAYCKWELRQAVVAEKRILPVLLQARTRIPPAVSEIQYVDFSRGVNAIATARLLGGLTHIARTLPLNSVQDLPETLPGVPSSADEYYEQAVALAYDNDGISLGILKRELNIGYERARALMLTMQTQGVIGTYPGGNKLHPLL